MNCVTSIKILWLLCFWFGAYYFCDLILMFGGYYNWDITRINISFIFIVKDVDNILSLVQNWLIHHSWPLCIPFFVLRLSKIVFLILPIDRTWTGASFLCMEYGTEWANGKDRPILKFVDYIIPSIVSKVTSSNNLLTKIKIMLTNSIHISFVLTKLLLKSQQLIFKYLINWCHVSGLEF